MTEIAATWQSGAKDGVTVIAGNEDGIDEIFDALENANLTVAERLSFKELAEGVIRGNVVILDCRGHDEALLEAIDNAMAVAPAGPTALLVAVDPFQLDQAWDRLMGRGPHILCAPTQVEWQFALADLMNTPSRVSEGNKGSKYRQLHHLNEEMAGLSDTVSAFTKPAADGRAADLEAPPVSATEVRAIIRARRLREKFFESLLADPAWDILLDLYAASLEGIDVSVTSLCIASNVPPTTALRWITLMEKDGIVERRADPCDRRRFNLRLSPEAHQAMAEYFTLTRDAGLPAT